MTLLCKVSPIGYYRPEYLLEAADQYISNNRYLTSTFLTIGSSFLG